MDPETFVGFTFVEKESLCRVPETFVGFTLLKVVNPLSTFLSQRWSLHTVSFLT